MFIIRVLLLPFSFLYGLIIYIRNKFFDAGIFSSKSFEMPVISVGNITVGGTGKSPHVEYLIRLLKDEYKIATLSRGYKRKTQGFLLADNKVSHHEIGDEPLQFYSKFPEVTVAVDEKRVNGVERLMELDKGLDVVLLDDAFQHRSIVPGLNVLLIRYSDIGENQFMLPSGLLREWRRGRDRADVIVVSKSPSVLSPIEARRITDIINPKPYQRVFYSYIKYNEIVPFNECAVQLNNIEGFDLKEYKVLLVSGIANASSFKTYLAQITKEVLSSDFDDHHSYSIAELLRIIKEFKAIFGPKKLIITTEKDSMRLRDKRLKPILDKCPVFYVPIEVVIHHNEDSFDSLVEDYVRRNKRIR